MTRRAVPSMLVLTAALAVSAWLAGPAGATTGTLVPGHGGQCLATAGGASANGTAVEMSPCDGGPDQLWALWADGTVHGIGDKCLDIRDHGTANGTPVQLWDCAGTPNQTWRRASGSSTARMLMNDATGMCLDVKDHRTDPGAPVQVWKCAQGPIQPNQLFDVKPPVTTELWLQSSAPGLCVGAHGSSNGTPVVLVPCSTPGPSDQLHVVDQFGAGEVRLNGKCLDIKDFGRASGTPVQLWDCGARSWNQTWKLYIGSWYVSFGTLYNPETWFALAPAGPAQAGTPVHVVESPSGPFGSLYTIWAPNPGAPGRT